MTGRSAPPKILMTVLTCLVAAHAPALASCGSDMCVLDQRGPESTMGRFSVDVGYQFLDQDHVRIGTDDGTVGEIPSDHNEIATRTEAWVVTARGGILDWLSLSASVPYIERMHRHEHEHHPGFFEEQEWNYSGLGDLMLTSYVTPWVSSNSPLSLAFQLGVKVPTGKRTVEEVDGDQPEPMARPGTGSFDGLAGVQLRRSFDTRSLAGDLVPVAFSVGVLGRVNGSGTEDYRAGNELQVNVGGGWALAQRVQLIAQVNTRWRAKDDMGQTDGERDNTGATTVFATPGVRIGVGPALAAYGYVQMRVYERVNGIQITAPYHLMFGTNYGF